MLPADDAVLGALADIRALQPGSSASTGTSPPIAPIRGVIDDKYESQSSCVKSPLHAEWTARQCVKRAVR
jgi:hypothetical protein